ncbi:hypothetical protein [Chitinophaga caseinilytica]|uniref:Natural product n=1 Tax=Chitinophaga caseinilytica TaxID=2267521 RepID=A0ABZ2Z583_9BACT
MKKLQLKALDLGAKEILSREQLRNVLGGNGSDGGSDAGSFSTCSTTCTGSKDIKIDNCKGTCSAYANSSVTCSDPDKTVNCPVL